MSRAKAFLALLRDSVQNKSIEFVQAESPLPEYFPTENNFEGNLEFYNFGVKFVGAEIVDVVTYGPRQIEYRDDFGVLICKDYVMEEYESWEL